MRRERALDGEVGKHGALKLDRYLFRYSPSFHRGLACRTSGLGWYEVLLRMTLFDLS